MVQYILVSLFFLFVCDILMAKRLDINPNNVFLSSIDTPSPVVKVGDLGNSEHSPLRTPRTMLILAVLQEGYDKIRVQSLPTRAPEVWRGLGCWHSSDVWSLGVTVSRIASVTILADCEVGTLVVSICYFWGQGQDSRRTY
jgi:serine/threonine protein kinase